MTTTFTITPPTRQLENDFFAIKYNAGGWIIHHKDDPRQAVWNTTELGEARNWSRLPDLKRFAEEHGHRAAITPDGWLEVYIEWTAPSVFGPQRGIKPERVRNMRDLRMALGY